MTEIVLRAGDRGPLVVGVRRQLGALGLQVGNGDPADFDGTLRDAVRAFQQQRGLIADGVVGRETGRALDAARWRLGDRILRLVPGHLMAGDDIAALQHQLMRLGVLDARVDGLFGPATERGMREFQRGVGVEPDGTCGPDTLRALGHLSRSVDGGDPAALRDTDRVLSTGSSLVGRVVVLDPGHGGTEAGAEGHGLAESTVALDLARRLEGRLTACGVTAVLTRGQHQNPSAADRAALAAQVRADVVVSLHCDAYPGAGEGAAGAHGVASFYWGGVGPGAAPASAVGARLAGLVQRELVSRTGLTDCRTHPRTWELLRLTAMPAVRIELGYLTHADDAALLADPAFRDTCVEAMLVAVQRMYLPAHEDATTGTLRADDVMARVRLADRTGA